MLGEQIRTLRIAHRMTQVQLAEKLGVSKQTVSNWENDNVPPSTEMLRKIAITLSCSSDYLLELDTSRAILDITSLTVEQIAHIQQIINDFQVLNKAIGVSGDGCALVRRLNYSGERHPTR